MYALFKGKISYYVPETKGTRFSILAGIDVENVNFLRILTHKANISFKYRIINLL